MWRAKKVLLHALAPNWRLAPLPAREGGVGKNCVTFKFARLVLSYVIFLGVRGANFKTLKTGLNGWQVHSSGVWCCLGCLEGYMHVDQLLQLGGAPSGVCQQLEDRRRPPPLQVYSYST